MQFAGFANHCSKLGEFLLHLLSLLLLDRDVYQRARVPFRQRLQFALLPSSPRNAPKILARISPFIRELTSAPARSTAMDAAIARNSCCAARSAAASSPRAAWLIFSISARPEASSRSASTFESRRAASCNSAT